MINMKDGYRTLVESLARWLSRDMQVRGYVLFLADNALARMKTVLKDASNPTIKCARNDIVPEKPTH